VAERLRVVVALAIAAVVLACAGRGPLAAPPLGSWGELSAWVDRSGAAVAAFTLVRLAALVVAIWCLALVGLASIARAAGAVRVGLSIERALPSVVRQAIGSVGLASVLALGAVAPAGADPEPEPVPTTAPGRVPEGFVEMVVLEPGDEPTTTTTTELATTTSTTIAAAPPTTAVVPPVVSPPTSAPAPRPVASGPTWTVVPGESFWSIAEDVMGERLGHAPTDVEIETYWRTLVDANRPRLLTPDPDLVYAGQEFVLP
jgi:hypothetical protein